MKLIRTFSIAIVFSTLVPGLLAAQNLSWTKLNAPSNGPVRAFATSRNAIYIGVDSFVYRSSDKGDHWTRMQGPHGYFIYAISAHDSDVFVSAYSAFYRSLDDGNTWQKDDSGLRLVSGFGAVASQGSNVFVASASAGFGSFVRSTDKGNTWAGPIPLFADEAVSSLVITNRYLYAMLPWMGLFRTPDLGETWQQLAVPGVSSVSGQGIIATGNNQIFVGSPSGLFRISDTSNVCVPVTVGLPLKTSNVPICLGDSEFLIIGSDSSLYRSSDDGKTWSQVGSGLPVGMTYLLGSTGTSVFAYNGEGIYRSDDSGKTWMRKCDGLPTLPIYGVNYLGDSLIVSTQNGLYESEDSGGTWQPVSLARHQARRLFAADSVLFCSTAVPYYQTLRSQDHGTTWKIVPTAYGEMNVPPIQVDSFLFAAFGYEGVSRSSDNGMTWTRADSGLPELAMVETIYGQSSNLFIALYNGGCFRSSDDGASWNPVDSGFSCDTVSSIVAMDSIVFAGTTGYSRGATGCGIYKSTSGGVSWNASSTGLANSNVFALLPIDNVLLAGTDSGVFLSNDFGKTWLPADNGLTSLHVLSLVYDRKIYAGTDDGLYESSPEYLYVPTSPRQSGGGLASCYVSPNPADAGTVIFFTLGNETSVNISLYSALGKQLGTIASRFRYGNNSVPISLVGLPAGTYYARIQTAYGEVQTVKLVKQ